MTLDITEAEENKNPFMRQVNLSLNRRTIAQPDNRETEFTKIKKTFKKAFGGRK